MTSDEIYLKRQIRNTISALENRAEKVFNKIERNPKIYTHDYVLLKYFDAVLALLDLEDSIQANK